MKQFKLGDVIETKFKNLAQYRAKFESSLQLGHRAFLSHQPQNYHYFEHFAKME